MTAKRKAVKSKSAKRRYPKLPASVQAAGGAVDVALVTKPGGGENMGWLDPMARRIEIEATLRGDQQWMTMFHELAHLALWDSGAHSLLGTHEELICDAIATARLREKFG